MASRKDSKNPGSDYSVGEKDREDAPAPPRLEDVIRATRQVIAERRTKAGSDDVKQEDVDLAADALVGAAFRPFPQLIAQMSRGSLTTVTELFNDWWSRFVARRVQPDAPGLELSLRTTLRIRHLMAGFEAAVREQLSGLQSPADVFAAAAALGERQALIAQIAEIGSTRDKLARDLEAMTYKVTEVESRLRAEVEARGAATATLQTTIKQLADVLERTSAALEVSPSSDHADIQRLALDVRRLLRSQSAHRRPKPAPAPKRVTRRAPRRDRAVPTTKKKTVRRPAKRSPSRKR